MTFLISIVFYKNLGLNLFHFRKNRLPQNNSALKCQNCIIKFNFATELLKSVFLANDKWFTRSLF